MPDDVLGRPLALRPDEPRVESRLGDKAGGSATPQALEVAPGDAATAGGQAKPVAGGSPGLGWPTPEPDGEPRPVEPGEPASLGWAVVDPRATADQAAPAPAATAPADSGPRAIPAAAVGPDPGPVGAPLAPGTSSTLGVIDGWWATLAGAPLPDTLLADRDLIAEGLDLTHAHPSGLATLLAGRPTRLSSLVRDPAAHVQARRRTRAIRAEVNQLAAERGVRAGYLALGLVSWWTAEGAARRDSRTGAPLRAPLLLRGCDLYPRGAGHEDYELDLDPAVSVNPEVLRRLREDHGIRLDGEALSGLAFGPNGFDPGPVFAQLENACSGVPGFAIDRRLVVGSFTAGSGALLGDLDSAARALRSHPLLGELVAGTWPPAAGEQGSAPSAPQARPGAATARRPFVSTDEAPDAVACLLPLDPAQRRAVKAAREGGSVIVHGPPGTGRTQTLAAAIIAGVQAGHRVLVVTPHRASARTLAARVAGCGLRDVLLDLHDGCGDQTAILSALGDDLEGATTGTALERAERGLQLAGDGDAAAVVSATSILTGASAALHAIRGPWGVSAYDAMEALAALMATDVAPRTKVRLSAQVCHRLDASARERLRADLHRAAASGAFTLTRLDTRWLDAAVHSEDEATEALAAAVAARDGLRHARQLMDAVAHAAGLLPAQNVAGWRPQLDLLVGVRDTLDVLQPAVFEQPIDYLAEATSPQGGPTGIGVLARRSLRRRARALVRPGVHVRDLHAVLAAAAGQRSRWLELSAGAGGWPRVPTGLAAAGDAVQAVEQALATLARYLEGTATPELSTQPLDQLARRLGDLAADGASLRAQPERTVLLRRLREAGLGELINDLRERRCIAEDVDGELDLAWWTSVLEAIIHGDPRLARHDPAQLAGALEELRGCGDRLAVAGVAKVRASLAERARAAVQAHPEQVRWLRAEIYRGHRSQWPADMFRRAPDLLRALRPVLVMSPDAVARTLPAAVAGRPLFDVVVVDDAGQVAMPEAAAALARGRQVLVAGDPYGLPPATGRPSVLEALAGLNGRLPVYWLDRDHRTRDGRLLLAARREYPAVWAATAGAAASAPLRLEHVWPSEAGAGQAGAVQTGAGLEAEASAGPAATGDPATDAEVQRVVDLVTDHAARRPGESLVVITMGPRHAERIEEALRAEVGIRPELARWLEVHWTGRISESFAVRPVHRLCGLERDAAIVSLGLGRTPRGRVLHRFGVLDGPYGRACLTAALTRARRRVTLVSAFTAGDLDPERLRTDGARMLWQVLAMAEDPVLRGDHDPRLPEAPSAGTLPSAAEHASSAASGPPAPEEVHDPLVADLRDRLLAVGLPVRAGIDAPDWPVSLSVADPAEPGRMLLAVDVDGEQHAACASVQVRDQQRREALERAGWTYVRVAAMDLFCDPAGEVERIRRAWRSAGGRALYQTPTTGMVIIGRPKVRATWPGIPIGRPIGEYSAEQLAQVASWVLTDGVPRGVEELVVAVCEALQLVLRGPRVEALVTAAARAVLGVRAAQTPGTEQPGTLKA